MSVSVTQRRAKLSKLQGWPRRATHRDALQPGRTALRSALRGAARATALPRYALTTAAGAIAQRVTSVAAYALQARLPGRAKAA